MATVSPALIMPFPLGSGSLMGQGNNPEFQLRIATSSATVDPPSWQQVPLATSKLRSYSVKRGRSAELEQVPPAAFEAVIDNNDRRFDPTHIANLVPNPSLEVDTSTWSLNNASGTASMVRDTAQAYVGVASLRGISTTAGANDFASPTVTSIPATAGLKYALSGRYKCTAFTAGAVSNFGPRLLFWNNGAGTTVFPVEGEAAGVTFVTITGTTADWTYFTLVGTAPVGATHVYARHYIPQGTVFYDAIQVEQNSVSGSYFDGDQPGYTWTGTAHGSTTKNALKPGNKIWLRALFSGQTFDRFVGDAASYTQRWPHGGHDAETSVQAADVLQRLARMKLPVMDPLPGWGLGGLGSQPGTAVINRTAYAQTYADVVRYDKPGAFWLMHDSALTESARADIGTSLKAENGLSSATNFPPIVGDNPDPQSYLILQPASGPMYLTADLQPGEAPDMGGLEEMTVEFWFKTDAFPASTDTLMRGPDVDAGLTASWAFNLQPAKTIRFIVTDGGGLANTVDTAALVENTWYHVVGTITGDNVRVYLNGVQQATDSFAGLTVKATFGTPYVEIGDSGGSGTAQQWGFSHVAAWRQGLSDERILAHYTAGTQRGYPRAQTAHERVIDVLDDTGLFAPRNIQTSTRVMRGAFSYGQPPIQELREAERLELADGLLFATRNGTISFLNNAHRSSAPYNTVQATFDMPSTTEPEYTDLVPDFSDGSLVNRWEGQAEGGLVQSAEDPTSLALNGEYAQQVSGLQTYDDSIVLSIVTLLLAKTKDPQHRIIGMNLNTGDPDTCEILLSLDIGDRIRVLWTPPAGGSQIDQTSFVQSINETGSRDDPRLFFQIGITPR